MKKIIITEEQEAKMIEILDNKEKPIVQQMPVPQKTNKPYCINPDKVLIVKKFLDNNFHKGNIEQIGSNGLIETIPIASINASNGDVMKNFYKEDIVDLLIEKFKTMFLDKIERELFMKQVLNDWFDNKIGVLGTLSVNLLRP